MKKFIKILIFAFIYNYYLSLLNISPVYAQSLSLSISPPILEVLIKPGKSITQRYTITNGGDPVIIRPEIMEYNQSGISFDPKFVPEKWITLINTDIRLDTPFLLKANENRQIIVRINPPAGTDQKDYYRALVISSTPNPEGDTSESSVVQNLGSPILISVTSTGIIPKSAQITNFSLPKIIDSFDTLNADIDVANTGGIYFRPLGKITLTGPVAHGEYTIAPNIILSGQTREIFTDQNLNSTDNSVTLSLSGFYFGKYTLDVNFTLDEGNVSVRETKTFYAFPWKISALIIIFLFLFTLRRKKRPKTNP